MKTTTHYTALIALTVALSQIVACGQGNSKKLKLKAKKARQSITNFKNGADTQNKALTKIKSTDELKVLTTNLEDGKSEMHRLMINKGKAKDSVTSIDMNITCVKNIEAATKMSLSHPGLFVLQGSTVRLVRNLNRKMTAKDLSKKNSSQTAKITNLEPLLEVTCGTNKDNKKEIFVAKNKDEAKVLNEIFKTVDLA